MIGWLSGQVADKETPGKLLIDVHGVGYDVETSMQTFFQLQSHDGEIGLHIHTVVREDALLLYGFISKDERSLFRELIKVNGIGPKLAIAILSSISPNEFIQCIQQQDAQMLTKLPGIGKKTAERLVIEMKDRLDQLSVSPAELSNLSSAEANQAEAIEALVALGYSNKDASKAVKKADDGDKSCEQLIREALQILSGR